MYSNIDSHLIDIHSIRHTMGGIAYIILIRSVNNSKTSNHRPMATTNDKGDSDVKGVPGGEVVELPSLLLRFPEKLKRPVE